MLQDRHQVMKTTSNRLREFIDILIRKSTNGIPVQANTQGDPSDVFLYLISWFGESLTLMENVSQPMTGIANQFRDILQNFFPLCSDCLRCGQCGHSTIKYNPEFTTLTLTKRFVNITDYLTSHFSAEEYLPDATCDTCKRKGLYKKHHLSQVPTHLFALNLVYNRVDNVNTCFYIIKIL